MTHDPEDLVGRTVGSYTLDRLIGQGGFAWVFAAHHAADGAPAAVKILKPRYTVDPEFEARFRNESKVASELHHPNVIRMLEIGKADGFTYFSMDLCADSLASRLAREGPLPEADLVRIATDLTAGLAFAHQAGIIHRDIKVDNVLLQDDGTAVIADFGIARAVSGYVSATGVNMTIGTPQYISPEQAQGRKLDGRSDLYALGVTLYKAATGDVPFRSTDWFELARMHVEEQPVAPRSTRPDLSARLERVILKCLAKHPNDRYPDADTLLEELRQLTDAARRTETFGVSAGDGTLLEALEEERRYPKWLVLALAAAVVAVVALAIVLLGG